MEALDNASCAHGLNLHRHFERVICALLMWAAIFFRGHPYNGVLPYAMIHIYQKNSANYKTWTLDWTGLWTGLDYGLD